MYKEIRDWNKKNIKNYIEIYIKKKNYNNKSNFKNLKKNIVGVHIKAELPKYPDITISNNFEKEIKLVSDNLVKRINNII